MSHVSLLHPNHKEVLLDESIYDWTSKIRIYKFSSFLIVY